MIITITGVSGSGKSTLGKMLAEKLKYKYYSIGDLQRKFAEKKGVTLKELRELEKTDKNIDAEFDNFQKTLSKKEDNFVLDSRLGAYFIKNSFSIFLVCEDDVRYKRIISDLNLNRSVEIRKDKYQKEKILSRDKEDSERLKELYGFDFLDKKNYNLVIDSTKKTPKQVLDKVLKNLKNQ